MTNTNDNVTKVFRAFEENPSEMNKLLKGNETEVIRGILNDASVSDEEVQEVTRQVNENNVMKLYLGADGQIDANQLMDLTGGFTSVERGKKTDAIGALLDGKLDIKDLLALITLMSGSSSSSQSSGSNSLLGSLFGSSQPQQQTQQTNPLNLFNVLLGGQTQQPQQQQQPSLFSSLFGLSQPQQQPPQNNTQLNALLQSLMAQQQGQIQVQQPAQPQQGQTMNDLLGTLFGQSVQQVQQQPAQSQSSSLLGSLFGSQTQQSASSNQMQNSAVLNAPLFTEAPSANTAGNNLNQFLNQSTTNSNGTVNVNSMFDLINILMGAKQ